MTNIHREPAIGFDYPDDEIADDQTPAAIRACEGEAIRGVLALISKGRTRNARVLRLETLTMLLRAGEGPRTVQELASRCQVSKRRAEQAYLEMRNFMNGHR